MLHNRARKPALIALLVGSTAISSGAVFAQSEKVGQPAEQHAISLPAGPLATSLNALARQSGMTLSADPALLRDTTAPALQGSYSNQQALDLLLGGSPLQAQRLADGTYSIISSNTNVLPAVTVAATGATLTTENNGSYGSGQISTFKGTQTLRRTPQPVTVVTRQVLEDQGITNMQDMLTTMAPGVTINYTDSERVGYFVRGHQIDSMQIDGLDSYQTGITAIQADTAVMDRIEVVRGANGLMRGAGNPSATVNMVRKMPTREFQAQGTGVVGSWDRYRGEADISGPLNDTASVRGRFVAVAENKRLLQRVRKENRRVFYGVLQTDLTPVTELTAGAQYTIMDATGALGSLPANADGTQLGLPRDTYIGAAWSLANREKREAFLELKHTFDNEWQTKMATSWASTELKDYRQSYFIPSPSNPYTGTMDGSVYGGMGVTQSVFNVTANGPFELAGRRHELVLGADVQRVRDNGFGYGWGSDIQVDIEDIRTFDPYNDVPLPAISGEPTRYQPNFTNQSGAYATARFSVTDPLTAIVGTRISWWDYHLRNSPAQDYSVNREITPYLGLVYDIARDWSIYTSYTEIFKPQRALNASGNIIDPIRGENYEGGIKGELMDGRLQASMSVFRINNLGKAVDDISTADPCMPHYNAGHCKMAGGKTRSEGWEAELQGQITPNWNLSGSYTDTKTRYIRDSSASNIGNPLRTQDPRHILRLYSSYQFTNGVLEGLTIGGGVQAQSDKYAAARGVIYRQSGLALYNAMAKYSITDNLSVQLNIYNLFDKVYYKQIGSGIGNYYGDARNWQLAVNARF